MFIDPADLSTGGRGWYLLNKLQHSASWTHVDFFHTFVTYESFLEPGAGVEHYGEGPQGEVLTVPEGYELPNGLELGDVIQYQWLEPYDEIWDHAVIIVSFEADGTPYVAGHSNDVDGVPYNWKPFKSVRFIHIERNNGYPPVKVEVAAAADDASGDPGYPFTPGYRPCAPFPSTGLGQVYFGSCVDSPTNILAGLRFANVPIPQGANVKYAFVTFSVDSYPPDFRVSLLAYGDASQANFVTNPLANRIPSGLSKQWDIGGVGYDTWQWLSKRSTPNLKVIIDPIISGNWNYGNAFSILFKNNPIPGITGTYYNHRRVIDQDAIEADPGFYGNYWSTRLVVSYSLDDTGGTGSHPPIVYSVTRLDPSPTNASSVRFEVQFSENVRHVDAGDFDPYEKDGVSGAIITDVYSATGDESKYLVTVNTGTGDGKIRLDVKSDASISDLDNPPKPLNGGFTTGESYTIDKTAPIPTNISQVSDNPTGAVSVDFLVTFSEPVLGVDITGPTFNDFTLGTQGVTGACISSVIRETGSQYRVSVNTGNGDGLLWLDLGYPGTIKDYATNPLAGGFESLPYQITKTPPSALSITPVSANPTNATSVDFTVAFSESVTGVDVGDFALTTTGITNAFVIGVSGSGDTYIVTVNTGSGDGTIRLDLIPNGTILDNLLTPLSDGYTSGQVSTIEKTPPIVLSSARVSTSPTTNETVDFTATFSEPVTGVDINDFSLTTSGTIAGATVTSVTPVSANVYTARVNTGTGSGTIRLNVLANGSVLDVALNPFTVDFITGEGYTIVETLTVQSVGTYDGWVLESTGTSGVGGTMNSTATTFNLGDEAYGDHNGISDKQYKAILHFDTSAIPDTAVITSATLKIRKYTVLGTDPFTTLGNLLVDMRKPSFGTIDLAVGDFQATAGRIEVAAFDPTPVNNWFSALINSSGRVYMNRTGTTQFRLSFAVDANDNYVSDYIKFYSGNHANAAVWPTLLIEYYVP
jgi:hypothetical protein